MITDAAIDAWRSRPAQERWLLGVPAAALLAVVLYIAVWEPLDGAIVRLRNELPELEARRELIRAQATELHSQASVPAAPVVNVALVQAAIERHRLKAALSSLEAAGQNRLRLAFSRVPFHAIWPLLQDLQTVNGIRIASLRVDRLDGGNVRLEAVLGAGDR